MSYYHLTEHEVAEMVVSGELLTIAALSARLNLPPHTTRRRVVRDGIPTFRLRRRVYVAAASAGLSLLLP
jgi:hypothetical protein